MRFEETPEQAALRAEIRDYFATIVTPEVRRELDEGIEDGPAFDGFVRRMGADGWLGVGWPKEWGGRGFTPYEQAIFFDEAMRAGARLPLVTINTVGPTLLHHGTEDQKAFYLPKILAGEIQFAIGYTEPGAGTDLASLQTRATRTDAGWAINGNKIFTSGAASSQYVWLAARTDPDAPKHKGITIFIVPTDAPGFSWTQIKTLRVITYATYYEDVHVGDDAIVGNVNEGWRLITTQLNFERAALGGFGPGRRLLEDVIAWARETGAIESGWVRANLARVDAQMEAFRLLNQKVAWEATNGVVQPADASAVKVYGTEINQEVSRLLMQVLGADGTIRGESGPVRGTVERSLRMAVINTFGGGANEVQRDIIAMAGLGLPRTGR